MGYGRWSDDYYRRLNEDRKRRGAPTFGHDADMQRRPYRERVCHAALQPLGVAARESRDSADHPQSLAVAVLFDVTGSMGGIPVQLQRKLPELMGLLTSKGYVDHPQVLFGAVGDATCDRVPLQIGQFESDNAMQNDLERFYLEGGGGGQVTESYELAMYFMARHTSIDCFEKRGKKGYLFLIGDEKPYKAVKRGEVKHFIGDNLQANVPTADVVEELQEKYEVYFIVPSGAAHGGNRGIVKTWRDLLGQNVLHLDDPSAVCETIALQIGIAEDRIDLELGLAHLADYGIDEVIQKTVSDCLAPIVVKSNEPGVTPYAAPKTKRRG